MVQEEPSHQPQRPADDIPLNDAMAVSFEVLGYASIHFHPKTDIPDRQKLILFERGLDKLADVLKDRADVHHVAATSWIVANNPDFFTRKRKFVIAVDAENSDVKALVAEYVRRRQETGMVPEEQAHIEPKVALLEMKDLLARLKS